MRRMRSGTSLTTKPRSESLSSRCAHLTLVDSTPSSNSTSPATRTTTSLYGSADVDQVTEASTTTDTSEEMWFAERNLYAPVTVVLVHLLFSSHVEWSHVWPLLTEYHLLLPDLPQHSNSASIRPFSFALCSDLIADMIRRHARDGRAHLAGISTGGFICQEIVRRHPDVVGSVFASTCCPLRDGWLSVTKRYRLIHLGLSVIIHSSQSLLMKAAKWNPELQHGRLIREVKRNNTGALAQIGCKETMAWSLEHAHIEEIASRGIRIALIATGKHDDIMGTRTTANRYRDSATLEGQKSRAYHIPAAGIAWNLQMPQLFATALKAWIERSPMPPGLEPLE